jgi:hypothetical protein
MQEAPTLIEIALKDISDNPYRRPDQRYVPLKLEEIEDSIKATGFWCNIAIRKKGNRSEAIFGHHRLKVLRKVYGPDHKIKVILLPDVSEDRMLQMFGNENLDAYAGDFVSHIDTVASVVHAYGAGQIDLPQPSAKALAAGIRYAPSFVTGAEPGRPRARAYTHETIAQFLGWNRPYAISKAKNALIALAYIEEKFLEPEDFIGLSPEHVSVLLSAANERKRSAEQAAKLHEKQAKEASKRAIQARMEGKHSEAQAAEALQRHSEQYAKKLTDEGKRASAAVIKQVAPKVAAGEIGKRGIREEAERVIPRERKELPEIRHLIGTLGKELYKILGSDDLRRKKVEEIVKFRTQVSTKFLADSLRALAERAIKLADALSETTNQNGSERPAKSAEPRKLRYGTK